MRKGWIAGLLVLGGCEIGTGASLSDGFEQDLTQQTGCGDLQAFAFDDADAILLHVALDAPLAAAAGAEAETVVTLPDAATGVQVEVGSKISDAACDDVIENGGPQVDETWEAVSGTVTVDVRPSEGGDRADVILEDVTFEAPTGEQVTVESFEWADLSVGWLPG